MPLMTPEQINTLRKLTPIGSNAIVLRDTSEELQYGSILKPYNEENKPSYEGTVLAVGPKACVKVGDRVIFDRYIRETAEFLGRDVLILDAGPDDQCDIFAVFTGVLDDIRNNTPQPAPDDAPDFSGLVKHFFVDRS